MTEFYARRRELVLAYRPCRFCGHTAWRKVASNIATVFLLATLLALAALLAIKPLLLLAAAVPATFALPPVVGAGATIALVVTAQVEGRHLPLDPARGHAVPERPR